MNCILAKHKVILKKLFKKVSREDITKSTDKMLNADPQFLDVLVKHKTYRYLIMKLFSLQEKHKLR